ncbi:MAG: hypothetical protein K9N55_06900 [Phycisphaerae bacterium]|nr:hypothetical protein [Phycisphaerae bacterium]
MDRNDTNSTPVMVQETINRVIKKMRYRKKVRADVRAELEAHFEDALAECSTPQEQQALAEELIGEFGDIKVLATLIRRAKKRCRPLWAKVMIRTGQVVGLCVLYVLLCMSRLMIGSPTIKVGMVDRINETSQQGHEDVQNAWPGIKRAMSLLDPLPNALADHPRYSDMDETQQQNLARYVQENQPAFAALNEAVKKPHCWRPFNPVPKDAQMKGTGGVFVPQLMETVRLSALLQEQLMPDMKKCRDLTWALNYHRQWVVDQGKTESAMADSETLFRLGHHLAGSGLLTEQMVGTAIVSLACDSLFDTLGKLDTNEFLLARTQQDLESLFRKDQPWVELTLEKAFAEDLIQGGFTDDGHGNGRALSSGVFMLGGSPSGWWKQLLLFNFPDRRQAQKHIDSFFEDLKRWHMIMPWDRRNQTFVLSDQSISTIYAVMQKPALERAGDLQWQAKLGAQAALTVLSIKRYQVRHGMLPDTLNALAVDGLMKTVPRDFYSDGPLTYQRKSDTDFVLYSWGENFQDDQGMPSTNREGESRRFGSQGDWVFWPILR